MKKILTTLCLALSVSALSLSAQDAAPTETPAAEQQPAQLIQQNGAVYTYVSTLKGQQANQAYNANLQIINQEMQVLQAMEVTMRVTQDEALKESLKKEYDENLEKFKLDQKTLFDTYGIAIQYKYITLPVDSHIYRQLTDEEMAELKKQMDDAKAAQEAGKAETEETGSLISQ